MKSLLTLVAVCSTVMALKAQNSCGTDEYYKQQVKNDSTILQKHAEAEAMMAQPILSKRATKYIIPVVFHVIHVNGVENISREQILDQIRVLNEDFSLTNSNKSKIRSQFTGLAADCEIEFRLAKIDPNGNCTDGINRIYSTYTFNSSQANEEIKKLPNTHWNYLKYLNVYVVSSIESSSSTTGLLLGYAVFPWATSAIKDGIVMRHDRLGTIGTAALSDGGRTLTHEVGHWLGLFHTFQDGCASTNDNCDDTPPVASTFTNANCPANGNSCSNEVPDRLDMWENYMDYSEGTCMAMFTTCQKTRMQNQLNATGPSATRKGLWTAANLIATGINTSNVAPLASFTSNTNTVCTGNPVRFYDNSCKGTVVSRTWTFAGGSPSTSSDESPLVTYNTPGKYQVKLKVLNSNGQNEVVQDNFITVLSKNGLEPQYTETFENVANIGTTNANSTNPQWAPFANAGYASSKCYFADITKATEGEIFSLIVPGVNLSKLKGKNPRLSFNLAYAPLSSASQSEVLKISISTNCGASYTQIVQRLGAGLYYTGAQSTINFVPSANNQWKLMNFSLAAYDTTTNLSVKFDFETHGGNSAYIDNINIGAWVAGVNDVAKVGLNIYPNPSSTELNIEVNKDITINKVEIINLAGQLVYSNSDINSHSFVFENNMQLKGLFLVKVTSNSGNSTTRVEFK